MSDVPNQDLSCIGVCGDGGLVSRKHHRSGDSFGHRPGNLPNVSMDREAMICVELAVDSDVDCVGTVRDETENRQKDLAEVGWPRFQY